MQSKGQTSTQTPQPLQLSGWTIAIGRSWRFRTLVTLPYVSRMASSGQMTPQAPQSMQRVGSMKKAFFGSPLIAWVGHRFSQAVQPVQFSATIVNGMERRYQRASAATTCGRRSALHFLQDFVLPPLLHQPVVAQRLSQADPGEEQHQDQHARDRDVVGLEENIEKLP